MRSLFNLSFRYKIPLWGGALIVATALITSSTLLAHGYDDLKRDLLRNAASRGRTLAQTLVTAVVQDHVWRAYEIINAPLRGGAAEDTDGAETLIVLDPLGQVFVSTRPQELPMQADFARLSMEYGSVAGDIEKLNNEGKVYEPPGSDYLYVATPIVDQETRLGTLLQLISKRALLPRFYESARQAAWVALAVLAVLLPINWYWGRRTATPLVRLTERMEELGQRLPKELPTRIYDYQDELGRLAAAYNRTVQQLREKALIEKEMIHSERLVAIGSLAAGIAHEINNPLLGMLTSISTLRLHGAPDARTAKTLNLLERGLTQIRDTAAALLVEAKLSSRDFTPDDIADVRTLIEPQAHQRSVAVSWQVQLPGPQSVPSTLVRQVLINLILNAVQATDEGGEVRVDVATGDQLMLEVVNGGRMLSEVQIEHLFEPFVNAGESGRGLGLWVCYQIVKQLGGVIEVDSAMHDEGALTRFKVSLPLKEGPA